ncbi:MAG: TetR family transcriptional regulator [Paracoccaceae bacterium]
MRHSVAMARPRIISDDRIHDAVLRLISERGEKAAALSAVARATGLAAPTLVQRFDSREGMVRAALSAMFDRLEARLQAAEATAPLSAKGAQALLKTLAEDEEAIAPAQLLPVVMRDPALRVRAAAWRAAVEQALALRLGGGDRGREAAALLFAAWQGQRLWQGAGDKGFRLKDAVKAVR